MSKNTVLYSYCLLTFSLIGMLLKLYRSSCGWVYQSLEHCNTRLWPVIEGLRLSVPMHDTEVVQTCQAYITHGLFQGMTSDSAQQLYTFMQTYPMQHKLTSAT